MFFITLSEGLFSLLEFFNLEIIFHYIEKAHTVTMKVGMKAPSVYPLLGQASLRESMRKVLLLA